MNKPTIIIEAYRDAFRLRGQVALVVWKESPERLEAGRIVFEPIAEGQAAEPTVVASREDLQRLADSLWEAGVRPMQAEGSVGQLAAVQGHLADMRHLAFAKCEVPRPESK